MKHPVVLEAKAQGLKSYKEGELSTKPDGIRYAQAAIDEEVALACTYVTMGVAPDPTFVWLYAAPRTWNGYPFPGTRWYADNVDTRYVVMRLDDKSTYEITIRHGEKKPSQISFMLWDWLMYEKGVGDDTDVPMATFVVDESTKYNADGSITLTVSPEPANGRQNYMNSKPSATQLYMREMSEEIESARALVDRAATIPLYVEDYHARLEEARTTLLESLPVTHSLNLSRVEDLTSRARTIPHQVQSELSGKLEGRKWRHVGLLLFWFYLALSLVLIRLHRDRAARSG